MPKSKANPDSAEVAETVPDQGDSNLLCSLDEVENHLRAFIAAFVLPRAQARWRECLIDNRAEWDTTPPSPRSIKMMRKAQDVMRKFAANTRYCKRIPNPQRKAAYYKSTFGEAPGAYFAVGESPCILTAEQADTKFSVEDESALLSFKEGKKALYFCHDGGVWKCEKE